MTRTQTIAATLAMLVAGTAAGANPFDELVAAERAFAAQGAKDGVRTSFLAWMADDALVYRPGPVNAKAFYEKRPDGKGKLLWGPRYALASGAGDLGITTGPWQFVAPEQGDKVLGSGWFFSVWRRGADGRFHWVIDHGVEATGVDGLAKEATLLGDANAAAKPIGALAHDQRLNALLAADRGLGDAKAGDAKARLAQALDRDSLCLRNGGVVDVGCTRIGAEELGIGGVRTLAGVHVAASGDLGVTSGYTAGEKPDADVRAWRYREGSGWKLIAVVMVPGG
jgi:hypothetical protein